MRAAYPVLLDHCATQRPDAICYDATNWPARLVAHRLGIPAVRCVPHLASNETFSLDARLTAGLDPAHPGMAAFAADCAHFSAEHGVHLDPAGTVDVPAALNLVFVPREFQPAADSFDDRFRFIGPLLDSRRQRESWSPRDPDAPTLFVSLGSVMTDAAFYRTCLAAFGDGPWQVAMTVADQDTAALGTVPSNVDIRPRFPQLAVLRHAAAFISHAGMNSIMEALCHGVPLITFPQTPEQVANADRVRELGLGERLDATALTPEAVRDAVTRVSSSPAIRTNLDRMRRSIQDSGGVARGADEIERHLGITPTAAGGGGSTGPGPASGPTSPRWPSPR